jgi:hypothetical protein
MKKSKEDWVERKSGERGENKVKERGKMKKNKVRERR